GVPKRNTEAWPRWLAYGAIGSAVLVLLVILMVVVVCYKRKKKQTYDDGRDDNIPDQRGHRGSTHDSENSLYGAALPTENTQRRGSVHGSENSLYGTVLQQ
ncbi:unnamed protein product, partial [Meganyctiphanes norvegica]